MSSSRTSDRLAWLGGADLDILHQVPSARPRFVQMAGVLITTAGLAVLSMCFALHDGLKASLPMALLVGLAWGIIILNLDRFMVISMGSIRDRRQLFVMVLPRLFIAAV